MCACTAEKDLRNWRFERMYLLNRIVIELNTIQLLEMPQVSTASNGRCNPKKYILWDDSLTQHKMPEAAKPSGVRVQRLEAR